MVVNKRWQMRTCACTRSSHRRYGSAARIFIRCGHCTGISVRVGRFGAAGSREVTTGGRHLCMAVTRHFALDGLQYSDVAFVHKETTSFCDLVHELTQSSV